MRKTWLAVALVLGLAFVVDAVAHSIAETRTAEELGRQFDLARPPDVSLSGWPFLVHVATGEFDEVRIRAPRLTQESLELSDIDLRLREVEVSLGKLFDGDPDGIRAHEGRGRASITGDSVAQILADQGAEVDVSIEGGVLFVTPHQIGQTFEGVVGLDGDILTISGSAGEFNFDIELPPIAEGMTYESVELRGDAAVLSMSFKDAVFIPV